MKLLDLLIFESFKTKYRDLAIYRTIIGLFFLKESIGKGYWLKNVDSIFFSPPIGLTALFTTPFPHSLIVILNIVLAISSSALIIGWFTKANSLITGFAFMTINSCMYSYGKINHDILFTLTPIVLAFSGWGNNLSLDKKSEHKAIKETSWPIALMSLIICVAMFTSGWAKLNSGWLNPLTYSAQGHLFINYFVHERTTLISELLINHVTSPILWELIDWLVVIFELSFILCWFGGLRLFRLWCSFACFFHLAIFLTFKINFSANIIAYTICLRYSWIPFSRVENALFLKTLKDAKPLNPMLIISLLISLKLILQATIPGRLTSFFNIGIIWGSSLLALIWLCKQILAPKLKNFQKKYRLVTSLIRDRF